MTRPLTSAQLLAATDLSHSLVVTAGAGSGKTRVLVERYLNLVDPTRPGGALAAPERVVAITFTNKAAREMLDRIRRALRQRAEAAHRDEERQAWQRIWEQTAAARVQTIHSFCADLLRDFPVEAGVDPEARVLEDFPARELLERAARKTILAGLDRDQELRRLALDRGLPALAEEVSRLFRAARAGGEDLSSLEARAPEGTARVLCRLLVGVEAAYAAEKTPAALDFEDLQLRARDLLVNHPGVRRRLRDRFRYVLVDEFQDTDALQDQIVTLLAGEPPEDRLFVVGDPKQSIYRFRHAEVGLFTEWQDRMRAGSGEVVTLAHNFRGQPGLVEFVNAVFSRLMGAASRPGSGAPAIAYEPLVAGRETEAVYPAVELLLAERAPGEGAGSATRREARLLAARLRQMVEGREELVAEPAGEGLPEARRPVRYGDIAVLFRTRTKLKVFETALAEAGIPYYVVGGVGYYQKPEVRDLIALLQAVDDAPDHFALAAALRSPLFGLPDDALFLLVQRHGDLDAGLNAAAQGLLEGMEALSGEELAKLEQAGALLARARSLRSRLAVPELIDLLVEGTDYEATLRTLFNGDQRVANVRKLRQVAGELAAGDHFCLTDFLAYLDRLARRSEEEEAATESEGGDAVQLLTVHAAKGLEFPVVVVADLARQFRKEQPAWLYRRMQGLYQGPSALDDEERRAELVRLFYVALTRARDHLLLTGYANPKQVPGREKAVECWLDWLLGVVEELSLPDGLLRTERDLPEGESALSLDGCPAVSSAGETNTSAGGEEAQAASAPVAWPGRRVAVTTVSELMCYAACPYRYHLQYRLGVPPARDWEGADNQASGLEAGWLSGPGVGRPGGLTPSARGTVVHRVIERLRSAGELEALLDEALREAGVAPAERSEAAAGVRPFLEKYLESPEFAAAARGDVVETEAPFFCRLAPGLVLRGAVDRLDRAESAGLRLLDFKTNLVTAEQARRAAGGYYRLQLQLYALAVEAAWRRPVRSAAFLFLWPGIRVEADLAPEALERARDEAAELARGLETGGAEPRLSPACAACGYLPLCDAGREWTERRRST